MKLSVREFSLDWKERYPIFCSPAYLSTIDTVYGWVGGYCDNRLVCFLPFTRKSRAIFTWITFQTATVFLDPEEPDVTVEGQFLDEVVRYFKTRGVDFIAQGPPHAVFRTRPAGSVFAPFGSYRVDLAQEKSELWANLHGKHRNVIRGAEQKGVQIEHSPGFLREAYEIMRMTMGRQGLPFKSEEEVDRLVSSLGRNVKVFVAISNGETQGCAIIPYSEHAAYYLLGGSIQNPVSGSLNLLHWVAMNHFREEGVRSYDFVGARIVPPKDSRLEGIQRFKERFGSRMAEGYLWKHAYSRAKYAAYAFAMRMKVRQRHLDIIDQELEFAELQNLSHV